MSHPNSKPLDYFLEKFKEYHGDFYNYKFVKEDFKNGRASQIRIVCPIHGLFIQSVADHMRCRCQKCSKNIRTWSDWLKIIRNIHGDKYDYSLVQPEETFDMSKKRIILCPIHGEIKISIGTHIYNKIGCKKCKVSKCKRSKNEWVSIAKEIHNDFFIYNKLPERIRRKDKVEIICPLHGPFYQNMGNHIYKQCKCPTCADALRNRGRSKGEMEIYNFLQTHNINFVEQKRFENLRGKRNKWFSFDFYLPDHNLCIEYDGEQHFKPIEYFGGESALIERRNNDNIKNSFCKEHNLKLIRIPYYNNVDKVLNDQLFSISLM